MFRSVMTIYNQVGEGEERWKRTIVHHIHWEERIRWEKGERGNAEKSGLVILLPLDQAKEYRPPAAFTGEGFTIRRGDWIKRGECEQEIVRSPSELGGAEAGAYEIKAVEPLVFGSRLDHLRIEGR